MEKKGGGVIWTEPDWKKFEIFYCWIHWKKFRKFFNSQFRLLKKTRNFLLLNSLKKFRKFFTVNFIENKFAKKKFLPQKTKGSQSGEIQQLFQENPTWPFVGFWLFTFFLLFLGLAHFFHDLCSCFQKCHVYSCIFIYFMANMDLNSTLSLSIYTISSTFFSILKSKEIK